MRKTIAVLLLLILGISSLCATMSMVSAQESTEPVNPIIRIRWLRFRARVNAYGDAPYHGSLVMNAKTVSVPTVWQRQWASVRAVWSNEQRPFASETKPVGEFTYTHYAANLLRLVSLKLSREEVKLNLEGVWNVNEVKITYQFDAEGVLLKSVREVTPIVTRAKGQLQILDDWKEFKLEIEDVPVLKGVGFTMITTRAMINPFSYQAGATTTLQDLTQIARVFRAMPGFGNYIPELDYNMNSKIDTADLTTVAANM